MIEVIKNMSYAIIILLIEEILNELNKSYLAFLKGS